MIGFRRPPWWAVLLTVAGALLFVRLGVWQLHRADFKETLLRRYAASAVAPVQGFDSVALSPPVDAFPRVRVQGHYLVDRLYLLDNPKHDERGGVEVFAPFEPSASQPGTDKLDTRSRPVNTPLLLVDLGFLSGNGTDQAPQLPPLPAGELELQGIYTPPPPTGFEMGGDALAQQTRWPKTSIFLDPKQVAHDLGRSLYPRVLALDADPASIYVRVHTLDLSAMPPARHRAYAFQWFTFALVAIGMLLVLNRRRPVRSTHDDSRPDEHD